MGLRVNIRMSKIIRTSIKVGVHTYATYAICRTLGEADGMICTEKSVTGKQAEDCLIDAEIAATGSERYYAASLFYIACVYIFSIIYGFQRKSDLLDEHTKN